MIPDELGFTYQPVEEIAMSSQNEVYQTLTENIFGRRSDIFTAALRAKAANAAIYVSR